MFYPYVISDLTSFYVIYMTRLIVYYTTHEEFCKQTLCIDYKIIKITFWNHPSLPSNRKHKI
jgi:hypothetical protein